jgi:hypothetical protein
MMGAEAVARFGAETIYTVARKYSPSARLRARDLIPPAIMVPPADAAVIEATRADLDNIVRTIRRQSFEGRAAKWWDQWAGPAMRRIQAVMRGRLMEHIRRREQAMWSNHDWTLKVQGERDRDAYTGRVRVDMEGNVLN